jgi:hypothetical protein
MSCVFLVFIHVCIHTRSPEGVTLLEVEVVEGEVPQEVQQTEEPEGERPATNLPECPDHQPNTSYVFAKL